MEDFAKEDRGIFQGLKVPFCLNAIILAFMAYVIFIAGAHCIELVTKQEASYSKVVLDLRSRLVSRLPALRRPIDTIIKPYAGIDIGAIEKANRAAGQEYNEWLFSIMGNMSRDAVTAPENYIHKFKPAPWWMYIVYGVWFLFIWSFFAGAINRVAAYRIARDESITLREALAFASKTWANHFLAIIFIGIFIAVCFYLCALGGLICKIIPYGGEIILIPGFFLVLLAAFLITLLLAGLLFGFNIISSAIGVDKVDSFDAISRSYSYVLGRPWQTLLYLMLPTLFLFFFLYFAKFFLDIAIFSIACGMGDSEKFMHIKQYIFSGDFESALSGEVITVVISAIALRIIYLLCNFFIIATVIAYWLSANTKAYFLLRKDVDGDEVDEMYLEEEELPTEETPEKQEEKAPQEKEEKPTEPPKEEKPCCQSEKPAEPPKEEQKKE